MDKPLNSFDCYTGVASPILALPQNKSFFDFVDTTFHMNGMGEGKDPVYITVSYWYFGIKATNAPLNYRNSCEKPII